MKTLIIMSRQRQSNTATTNCLFCPDFLFPWAVFRVASILICERQEVFGSEAEAGRNLTMLYQFTPIGPFQVGATGSAPSLWACVHSSQGSTFASTACPFLYFLTLRSAPGCQQAVLMPASTFSLRWPKARISTQNLSQSPTSPQPTSKLS